MYGDLQCIAPELEPAAIVLHDATETLGHLHDELGSWEAAHVYRPRTEADRVAELEAHVAKYSSSMMPEERERYRVSLGLQPMAPEPPPAGDSRAEAQARGSIADMISSQPGSAEEALRRLKAGATLAQVCGVESVPEDAIPEAIRRHLLEQQQRACELQEILQMLADRIDDGASVAAGCMRLAHALNEGLDSHTLCKLLEGQPPRLETEVAVA